MKKSTVWTALIVLALMACLATPALALGLRQTTPASPLDMILSVLVQFAQLAGVGAAIAAIVNVLKVFKLVTDTTAGQWFAGFNLLAIVVLVYLKIFQPQIAIEYIDAQAAVFAQIILLVLGYVVQLGSGKFAHGLFSGLRLPLIGKTFSRP